jgi:hypothetical protein
MTPAEGYTQASVRAFSQRRRAYVLSYPVITIIFL